MARASLAAADLPPGTEDGRNSARGSHAVATYLLTSTAYHVYLVNPNASEILGQPVYPSHTDLSFGIELFTSGELAVEIHPVQVEGLPSVVAVPRSSPATARSLLTWHLGRSSTSSFVMAAVIL